MSASLAQIGEFSFILAGLGVEPRPAAAARTRPDPGRRHHLDPAQPGAVRLRRPLPGAVRDRTCGARTSPAPPRPRQREPRADPARPQPRRPRRAGRLRPGRPHRRQRSAGRTGVPTAADRGDQARRRRGTTSRLRGRSTATRPTPRSSRRPIWRLPAVCSSPFPMRSRAGRSWRRRGPSTPTLPIIARSHSEEETEHLKKHGATKVIMGEHEIAIGHAGRHPSERHGPEVDRLTLTGGDRPNRRHADGAWHARCLRSAAFRALMRAHARDRRGMNGRDVQHRRLQRRAGRARHGRHRRAAGAPLRAFARCSAISAPARSWGRSGSARSRSRFPRSTG